MSFACRRLPLPSEREWKVDAVPDPRRCIVHATAISFAGRGVLIVGPSGSGKSDLALRAITTPIAFGGELNPATLVADDQVIVDREGNDLLASPPPTIAGKLEVRGIGIVELPYAPRVPLRLVVRLVPVCAIERMPEPSTYPLLGIDLPQIEIDAREAGSLARLAIGLHLRR